MRYLLHWTLFALALTTVAQARAQDRHRGVSEATILIASSDGPRRVRLAEPRFAPPHAIHNSRRTIYRPSEAAREARRAYIAERQDLDQIVRIANRWQQATANRNRYAQWKIGRRLDAWIDREIRESYRQPWNHRYSRRLQILSDELARLDRRAYRMHGYLPRGEHERGDREYRDHDHGDHDYRDHGHGYPGYRDDGHGYDRYGRAGYRRRKAQIIDELIMLSERQVRMARLATRDSVGQPLVYR